MLIFELKVKNMEFYLKTKKELQRRKKKTMNNRGTLCYVVLSLLLQLKTLYNQSNRMNLTFINVLNIGRQQFPIYLSKYYFFVADLFCKMHVVWLKFNVSFSFCRIYKIFLALSVSHIW